MKYTAGTKLTVGSHDVLIIKYISEGGFAHVYTCHINPPYHGQTVACLKRVLVPSKWQLGLLRQEVDAMKRLRGNRTIVSYIDSHASRLTLAPAGVGASVSLGPGSGPNGPGNGSNLAGNGSSLAGNGASLGPLSILAGASLASGASGYEVLLLMEYCSNTLIDYMNTRLSHKLTEPEILVIMKDITQAVAMCHHLVPPLLHRDIKIENVLLDGHQTYKLCDFGSAVPYAAVPKTALERAQLQDDIMQHTTPQYRAPEMIDLSKNFPIDDKLDVWALGCFLYKLCYYTTPFELPTHSSLTDLELAILAVSLSLKLPPNGPGNMFSPRLKNVIKCCLREDPRRRPNAGQLLEEVCGMMGVKVPNVIPSLVLERPLVHGTSGTMSQGQGHSVQGQGHSVQGQALAHSALAHSVLSLVQGHTVHSSSSTPNLEPRKLSGPKDPFAGIEKTRFGQGQPGQPGQAGPSSQSQGHASLARPKSFYDKPPKPRPASLYSRDILPLFGRDLPLGRDGRDLPRDMADSSLKDYLQKLSQSTENITRPSDGTLDFLKDMEEEKLSSDNTGGSFKAFRNGLRKISTGSRNTSRHNTGNDTGSKYGSKNDTGSKYGTDTGPGPSSKRSSITSLKQILTGGRKTSNPSPETEPAPDEVPKKLSIQRRMAQYLNNPEEKNYKKTATGYGRFTTDEDDLEAINGGLKPPKVPASLSSRADSASKTLDSAPAGSKAKSAGKTLAPAGKTLAPSGKPMTPARVRPKPGPTTATPASTPGKPDSLKKPPPKPKKPVYLQTKERRSSDASDISMPDVDDLEKQFAKRFPSYV